MATYFDGLRARLLDIRKRMGEIYANSRIFQERGRFSAYNPGAPPFNNKWVKLSEAQRIEQVELVNSVDIFIHDLQQIVPPITFERIYFEVSDIKGLIQARSKGETPDTVGDAWDYFNRHIDKALAVIAELESSHPSGTLVVPDTNVFVQSPDPATYKKLVGAGDIAVGLTSTLLRELDRLKIKNVTPEFRDKVNKAIRRVKGWREQGKLTEGVKVSGISVFSFPADPNFENLPKWLSPSVDDDQFIGTVLGLQVKFPAWEIVVITTDINMQNKLDLAGISFLDHSP